MVMLVVLQIDEVCGGEVPNADTVSKLTYTTMVLKVRVYFVIIFLS